MKQERYYMVIFGYQGFLNRPKDSHTFATFVKETSEMFDSFTISWLPTKVKVRVYALSPESGRNFSLEETLELAAGYSLRRWGPVEIRKDLYDKAVVHFDFLNTGKIYFKSIDRTHRNSRKKPSTNCIHAVTDIGGLIRTGIHRGLSASAIAYQHLSSYYIDPQRHVEHIAVALKIQDILKY